MQLPPADTPHTLTRAQVASRLGISTSSVRRLEYDRLYPVQDARGVHRFDPAEVDALTSQVQSCGRRPQATEDDARRRATEKRGRVAARVFRMFSRGVNLAQIVVATRIPPDVVRELYREWCTSLEQGEWERRATASEP